MALTNIGAAPIQNQEDLPCPCDGEKKMGGWEKHKKGRPNLSRMAKEKQRDARIVHGYLHASREPCHPSQKENPRVECEKFRKQTHEGLTGGEW